MKNKAFTLIELLVVISIISLLSTVVMYSVSEAKIGAQDAHKKVEVGQVKTALEIYKDKNNDAPRGLNAEASATFSVAYNENSPEYQSAMQTLVDAKTIPEIPRSPNGVDYFYLTEENGEGVFGTILRSDNEIDDSNGCYFSSDSYGCSRSGGRSYINEFDRDSLIQNAIDCIDSVCDDVVSEGGSGGEESSNWTSILAAANFYPARSLCWDLSVDGHDDWRLPTVAEAEVQISAFSGERIWTSDYDRYGSYSTYNGLSGNASYYYTVTSGGTSSSPAVTTPSCGGSYSSTGLCHEYACTR